MTNRFAWDFEDIVILSYPPEIINDLHRRDADVFIEEIPEKEVREDE